MLVDGGGLEVDLDGAQDGPHTLAALRAGGVVDEVFRNEVV
jgi:hypothetical protein